MKNTNGVELFLVLALPASFAHYLCIMIVPQKGATQLQTSLSLSLWGLTLTLRLQTQQ